MGVDTRRIPDYYLCELCNARELKVSAEKAHEMQLKKLEKRAREKERRRAQHAKRKMARAREKERRHVERRRARQALRDEEQASGEGTETEAELSRLLLAHGAGGNDNNLHCSKKTL